MTRLLVTGGRDFLRDEVVAAALSAFHAVSPITVLGHGDCPTGADRLAAQWASLIGVPQLPYPADWALYGGMAGRVRNARMLREFRPDVVMKFPGGSGTRHMALIAREAGVPVAVIDIPRDQAARG